VIDDVLGLLILGAVSSIAAQGQVNGTDSLRTIGVAIGFLAGSFWLGRRFAAPLSALFAAIHRGAGMKFAVALAICFVFAYGAHAAGLAPIVGAFAAGLVLEPVHFLGFESPEIETDVRNAVRDADPVTRQRVESLTGRWTQHHLEHLIEPVAHLLVPIFFVAAGLRVRLEVLMQPDILIAVLAVTLIAIIGKLVSGAVAGPVDRWLVGWGMVPRGEVGLIFALVGHSLGVLDDEFLGVVVMVVVLTTLVTPPVLERLLRAGRRPTSPPGVEPTSG
jgi:Kef-type K+ transport system membrane component KefB